jgi:CDP-paratose 2-epimerase
MAPLRILITGVCGFVGRWLADCLIAHFENLRIVGVDNLSRAGSEGNRNAVMELGVDFRHCDLRSPSDLDCLPEVDWVIDSAAMTNVMAGVDGQSSSRQVIENNLIGTLNLLELCRRMNSGLILLSTSRVYSIRELSAIPLQQVSNTFRLDVTRLPACVTDQGIIESFSTGSPTSLYGATKLTSERMAQEYSDAFGFPLRINRCGVMSGAGQFGKVDQGIFSYWIHAHRNRIPLKYIGFGGKGLQVRDCLHPRDLAILTANQLKCGSDMKKPVIANVSGGIESARSLAQLTQWCDDRFGKHIVAGDNTPRPFDLPWVVLDSTLARTAWSWKPEVDVETIFDEIASAGQPFNEGTC